MLGGDLRCECTGGGKTIVPPLKRSRLFLTPVPFLVHLERLGHLSEESVQLYAAELSSALSYLHEKRIIHRCADPAFMLYSRPISAYLLRVLYHLTKTGTSNRIISS